MSCVFWFTDGQMAGLSPFLPKRNGQARVDGWRALGRVMIVKRNGLRSSDERKEYGRPKTLANRWK